MISQSNKSLSLSPRPPQPTARPGALRGPGPPFFAFGPGGELECVDNYHGFLFNTRYNGLPSGKHTKNYGKSPFSMGKSTIMGYHVN